MKKIGFFVLLIVSLSTVSAQSSLSFRFDDRDFTYFGSKEAYLALSMEDDALVVHLSDQPTGMKTRFSEILTPMRTDMDGDGQVKYEEADYRHDPQKRLRLAKLAHCEVSRSRAIIGHENASVRKVAALYSEALQALGFEPETKVTLRGSARDYVFVHGSRRLRVSFSHGVDDGNQLVKVRLTMV